MALKATFERVIDKAYHTTGNTDIVGDGFGQLTPFEILQRLRKTYGRANIQEIEVKLLHLNNLMDRDLPVEVMIRDIKDLQRFLLANPADNTELTDVQLCTHGLIKISKNGDYMKTPLKGGTSRTGPSANNGWISKRTLLTSMKKCSPQMEEQQSDKRDM